MTRVPYAPNWCWNLLGAEALSFSQPTHAEGAFVCLPCLKMIVECST